MSIYDHMSKELKPCPFCGSTHDAPIEEVVHLVMNEDEWHGTTWTIQCDNCTATLGYLETPEEAVETWNKRA